jgi:hypothetical protein
MGLVTPLFALLIYSQGAALSYNNSPPAKAGQAHQGGTGSSGLSLLLPILLSIFTSHITACAQLVNNTEIDYL